MYFKIIFQSPHRDIVYEVTGSAQASNFFGVYEDTGIIFVKQNLMDDLMKNTRFTVIYLLDQLFFSFTY